MARDGDTGLAKLSVIAGEFERAGMGWTPRTSSEIRNLKLRRLVMLWTAAQLEGKRADEGCRCYIAEEYDVPRRVGEDEEEEDLRLDKDE